MYTPYDRERDEQNFTPSLNKVYAGAGIAAGALVGKSLLKQASGYLYNNNEDLRGWYNHKFLGKGTSKSIDKGIYSDLFRSTNPVKSAKFLKTMKNIGLDAASPAMIWRKKGAMRDLGMVEAFGHDVNWRQGYRNLLSKGETKASIRANLAKNPTYGGITVNGRKWNGRTLKAPLLAGLFTTATINAEYDRSYTPTALYTGLASDLAGTIGGRVGMSIGSAIGFGLTGGNPIGAAIGAGLGMVAGGAAGFQVFEAARTIKSYARKWTMPDLGGQFTDSFEAQTMRARSLNAIRTSQFNVRSELGNESIRLVTGY